MGRIESAAQELEHSHWVAALFPFRQTPLRRPYVAPRLLLLPLQLVFALRVGIGESLSVRSDLVARFFRLEFDARAILAQESCRWKERQESM